MKEYVANEIPIFDSIIEHQLLCLIILEYIENKIIVFLIMTLINKIKSQVYDLSCVVWLFIYIFGRNVKRDVEGCLMHGSMS